MVSDCSGPTVQFSPVWSGPVLNLSQTSTVRGNYSGREHGFQSQGRQSVSNALKQNTYLRQPVREERRGGEGAQRKSRAGGKGDAAGGRQFTRRGKRNRHRERWLEYAAVKSILITNSFICHCF